MKNHRPPHYRLSRIEKDNANENDKVLEAYYLLKKKMMEKRFNIKKTSD